MRLAEEAEPELKGPDQLEWLERLEAEHDNMRAALSWSLGGADAELGLRLAGALWYFWSFRGYFSEGRGWLEEAIAGKAKAPPTARARALRGLASLAVDQGDYERAEVHLEEELAIARELNEPHASAQFLLVLGIVVTRQGDHRRAKTLLEESLLLHRELGFNRDVAECLEVMAEVARGLWEDLRAARLWGAAGALREATDNPWLLYERRLHEPYLASARSRIDEAEWTEAWEEGRAMTLDEAISYALEEEEAGS